jgi:hypothetical protein
LERHYTMQNGTVFVSHFFQSRDGHRQLWF